MDNIEILKQTGLFEGLSDEELKLIEQGCVEQAYPMSTVIIEENDAPKEMLFIIKNGEIVISTAAAEDESDSFLTTLGSGEAFGEVSLIDNEPHSATVRTLSDAIILLLPGKYFNTLVEQNKGIGYFVIRNIARLVCQRLRTSNFTTKHFGLFGKLD